MRIEQTIAPPSYHPHAPAPPWDPRLPTTSTYAWVTSLNPDGSFFVQETPGGTKYRTKKAASCALNVKRGDLVYVVTDGHYHYAIAVLHRQTTPALRLVHSG